MIWLLCAVLVGCAGPAPPPPAELTAGPKTETIFLVARGWHTDVGVLAAQAGDALGALRTTFPGVHTLLIGFGERAYLLRRHNDLGNSLAALVPGAGALLVTALRDTPQSAFPVGDVIVLHVSARGLARLTDFIAVSFERAPDSAPREIADGPYPGSLFYASTRTYSAGYTCNTWTAEALQTAGLPVRAAGVIFADEVADQARRVAGE
ncbi:MAG TPA: DUF2459 domain-containing protein [Acetobacteraceae bacterium]|jgi:uncharacterized protein (TIGR02117 family)|nr:DUF2459 domain-containing protein [Acetobacteraceae bacterium]